MSITQAFTHLSELVIKGYKSIIDCKLSLSSINILIGCNGAGKSNFISFFKLMRELLEGNLQYYVSWQGGPDPLLYFGRKRTSHFESQLSFGKQGYFCALEPTKENKLVFRSEAFWSSKLGNTHLGSGHFESLARQGLVEGVGMSVLGAMKQWRVYHFHDTGDTSLMKQPRGINDNRYLRSDASNLAAYLLSLKECYPDCYHRIVKLVKLAAPFFGDFHLRPSLNNKEIIEFEWIEEGSDVPFKAHYLSDGTLRFICLATVFMQPEELQPDTIIVDEPELGLHPYAIQLLASLIKSTAKKKQLILATQSVEFLNHFQPEDVIIVDREAGCSTFKRLDKNQISDWLDEYTLGDLWKKNLIGGRPAR